MNTYIDEAQEQWPNDAKPTMSCPSCGEPMEYDAGQPMGDDEPDIAPEWFCECGEVILAEAEARI